MTISICIIGLRQQASV